MHLESTDLSMQTRAHIELNLGSKNLDTSILHIPAKLCHSPSSPTECMRICNGIVKKVALRCCLVEPKGSPKKLILKMASWNVG
jgi:hypothetical protein